MAPISPLTVSVKSPFAQSESISPGSFTNWNLKNQNPKMGISRRVMVNTCKCQ